MLWAPISTMLGVRGSRPSSSASCSWWLRGRVTHITSVPPDISEIQAVSSRLARALARDSAASGVLRSRSAQRVRPSSSCSGSPSTRIPRSPRSRR